MFKNIDWEHLAFTLIIGLSGLVFGLWAILMMMILLTAY